MVHLAIANFTGSLRLLTGFGWPMIYAVAAFFSRRRREAAGRHPAPRRPRRRGPGPAAPAGLLRRGLGQGKPVSVDAAVLTVTYVVYSDVLLRIRPARRRRSRTRRSRRSPAGRSRSKAGSAGPAVVGAVRRRGRDHLLVAEPFLNSMLALAGQPRNLAVRLHPVGRAASSRSSRRRPRRSPGRGASRAAPVALMNMVSSNINQWGVLSGLLAVIYCWSHGDDRAAAVRRLPAAARSC